MYRPGQFGMNWFTLRLNSILANDSLLAPPLHPLAQLLVSPCSLNVFITADSIFTYRYLRNKWDILYIYFFSMKQIEQWTWLFHDARHFGANWSPVTLLIYIATPTHTPCLLPLGTTKGCQWNFPLRNEASLQNCIISSVVSNDYHADRHKMFWGWECSIKMFFFL